MEPNADGEVRNGSLQPVGTPSRVPTCHVNGDTQSGLIDSILEYGLGSVPNVAALLPSPKASSTQSESWDQRARRRGLDVYQLHLGMQESVVYQVLRNARYRVSYSRYLLQIHVLVLSKHAITPNGYDIR